ncbi:MAG: VWA domain-containing protein [Dysosmobacter sp.]|uniref:VWA domain-containing protein n=1 Tax=Dysosmobacter sp. TaxID=2591382 RepID=UPI002840FA5A|nr:VWA domain-containing protein [Dysosmobacter sp.]MDR3983773.1 VWA domain-containing protein [Dysosmobacter sp.]
MFASFFYLLRQRGLDVSLNEWLTLLQGMEQGLHRSSLTGFYQLCRAVLVKSEAEYDRFDQVFLEFFKDVPWQGELPEEVLQWLEHPKEDLGETVRRLRDLGMPEESLEELLRRLEERLKEQTEEHNGGNYWVGTQGRTPWGNSGWHPGGIRIGGQGRHRTAMTVAGERKYRDFRKDNTLDTRQFQMAFRLLRQLSVQADSNEKVLDVDGTIRDTCDNAGTLKVRYKNPRKNAVKVLLLMDSGGSMEYYAGLCSMLFQAATKSNNFKELHTYYFHNCVYSEVYTHPGLRWDSVVPTEWLLQNYDASYKVIIVGDGAMSPYELREPRYDWEKRTYGDSGLAWLERLRRHYPYLIWLNPEPMPARPDYWSQTHWQLAQIFHMYDLSAEGLEQGMKRLMVRR